MPDTDVELRREQRKIKMHLTELTEAVMAYLVHTDAVRRERPSLQRAQQLSRLLTGLEYANDQARYFGLGIDYRTDRARKERFQKELREKEGIGT